MLSELTKTQMVALSPDSNLLFDEFVRDVLRTGSLISLLENKKINMTNMVALLLERTDYQEIFVELTSCENFKEAIFLLLYLYPSLLKSKVTKTAIRRLKNATTNNGLRKDIVQ